MKKFKLLMVASGLLLAQGGLISCGNNSSSLPQSSINESSSNVSVISFNVSEIADCTYGTEINFTKYVQITLSDPSILVSLKCESLTPDTLTIDESKVNVGIVTGVGECKVKLSALGEERIITFNAYATVSSIKVKDAPKEILEGSTLDLDEYVTVTTASPTGSKGKFFATSKSPEVVKVLDDGHTVEFVGSGSFLIELKDFSNKKKAYFTGKVTSVLQKQIKEFAANIGSNYTAYSMDANTSKITSYFPTIHTANYFAYPYGFQLPSWDGIKDGKMFWGMMKFPDGNVYEFTSGSTASGQIDMSTLELGALQRGDVAQYYGFTDFNKNAFDEFESHKTDGVEDYLVADYTSQLSDILLGDVLGITVPSNYAAKFAVSLDKFNGKDALYVYLLDENDKIVNMYCISDVHETDVVQLSSFVSDISNEKDKIQTTEIENVLKNIISKGNYTVTSKTYIGNDATGVPYTFDEAIAIYPPLHTLYYEGIAKYTENAMMINNTELFQGFEGLQDKTKAEGYIEEDGKVLSVSYDAENKKFVKGETPLTDANGNNYTNYEDYFNTLGAVNFDTFKEFIMLDHDEETNEYSFSIGPKSVNGSDNLRALTNFVNPEMSTTLFPTSLSGNDFEAGYAGQGYFRLNADGGYSFFYYSSRIATATSGGSIEFRICIEYTVSNIGTTTIDEYDGL